MKHFLLIILTFICLSSNAQTLKTYSGEYNCINKRMLYNYGKATYTYFDGEDRRIYNGNFSYSDRDRTLKGKFKDDKQTGVWTLSEKINFNSKKHYYNGRLIISITYKDGIPDGPFSISLVDSKSNTTRAYIKATFNNGKLVGNVAADMNDRLFDFWGNHFDSVFDIPYMNKMTGSFDENGMPSNIWIVNGPTHKITETYNQDGTYNVITINTSTGDRVDDYRPAHMPTMLVEAANYAIRKTSMRSSEKFQLKRFNFGETVSLQDNSRDYVEYIE